MPLAESVPLDEQTVTSTGTSAQSTVVSTSTTRAIWHIKAVDGAIWIKFGTNPTAASGDDIHLASGETYECAATTDAEKVAIIDA